MNEYITRCAAFQMQGEGGVILKTDDAVRLVQESLERLGRQSEGLKRTELISLVRRVIELGVAAVKAESATEQFEVVAWASVEARSGRRPATRQDLRHFVRRMLRVEGGERPLRKLNCLRKAEAVIPRNWMNRWRELRHAAGLHDWRPDTLRHTFATYHALYFRNLEQLRLEMGHRNVDLLRSRYVLAVGRSAAVRFWRE